jgi:mannose-1-phosphate guanylyltransferase/mannose-6-phosphate isomerase
MIETNKIQTQPVILCGGAGTRLWPLSRSGFPKQFLCFGSDESLFQLATKRLAAMSADDLQINGPYIVSNNEHRFLAQEQLREAKVSNATFLLEPVSRNTAPALTLAALAAVEGGNDPVLVVTPADQTIADLAAFTQAVQQGIREAAHGSIVILGVVPDRAEIGYGYVKVARSPADSATALADVERFVEKPDAATAQAYIEQGGYLWNAGMFVVKASVWLAAIKEFRTDIAEACLAAWATRSMDGAFVRPGLPEFSAMTGESIDYAVMESCPGSRFVVKVAPLAAGWSDLGAWDAVWNALDKDDNGNVHLGDVTASDTHDTLVYATTRLVGLVGVKNLVVIETADAVLVVDKARGQDVKQIVNSLNAQQREEHLLHRKVHRPWGWYDSIDEGGRFKVKRIQVKPKASLSLQMHHHRAEHWIVVSGTAEITNGDKTLLLSENQSTYIPLGEVHRLSNPGTIPLEIIEVQSGSYLGEDDIVRFEDNYGRQ